MSHLVAALAIALMIGFMAQRTGLCMVRGVDELRAGRPALLLGMLICGVWVWAFAPLASAFNAPNPLQGFAFHWSFVAGGFAFGLGAAFNQGCTVSTMSRLARGDGRMLATIAGWTIGWYLWLQLGFDVTHRSLPMLTGWPLVALILTCLTVSVWALVGPPERRTLWLGVMLFGILAGLLFLFEPRWSPSDLVRDSSDAWFRGTGWPTAARIAIAAALIAGMAWATWLKRGFRWHRIALDQAVLHLAAGTLMGVGAAMSLGGNDAQLLRALPTLSPAGMAAVLSIIIGIIAGSSLRRKSRGTFIGRALVNKLNYRRLTMRHQIITFAALAFFTSALHAQTPSTAFGAEVISADYRYAPHFVDVAGSRIHYIEQGEGEPILMLHGNPTSSYLWRNVIPFVSPVGRVIAMDLIGFGESDKPNIAYTFQDHYRYVEGFVAALGLKNVTLVIHDWGSVLGLEYAREHPGNVKAIAMMEAIIPPAFPMPNVDALGDLFRQFRDPTKGRELLIDQNVFIEQILADATITRKMTTAEMDHYRAAFIDPASRLPIYVWPNELPIGGEPGRNVQAIQRIGEWLKQSSVPKLLLYARPGAIVTPEAALWMQENYRNLEAVFIGYGRHYVQEDQPESIGRNIAMWYRRVDTSR